MTDQRIEERTESRESLSKSRFYSLRIHPKAPFPETMKIAGFAAASCALVATCGRYASASLLRSSDEEIGFFGATVDLPHLTFADDFDEDTVIKAMISSYNAVHADVTGSTIEDLFFQSMIQIPEGKVVGDADADDDDDADALKRGTPSEGNRYEGWGGYSGKCKSLNVRLLFRFSIPASNALLVSFHSSLLRRQD